MIVSTKAAFVHIFTADIGRIAVKEGTRSVVVVYQHLEILVFNYCVLHSPAQFVDK